MDAANALSEDVCRADIGDLLHVRGVFGIGNRIQKQKFAERALFNALQSCAGENAVGGTGENIRRSAEFHDRFGRSAERSRRVDNVIQDQAVFAFHIADDIHHFRLVCLFPALVDNGQVQPQLHGEGAGPGDGADVRRDDDIVIRIFTDQIAVVLGENISSGEIVYRNIKKTLDLRCMEIHCENPVRPGGRNEIRHQFRGDGVTALGLAVLPRITEIRHDGGDPPGGRTAAGVDHDKKFHQIVVDRFAGRLDDKHIAPANRFLQGNGAFSVGELGNHRAAEIHKKIAADLIGKIRVGIAGEDFDFLRMRCHKNF